MEGIYRGSLLSREEAMNVLLADGWDRIGAEAILDTIEEQGYWVDTHRLLQVSADYKDR